MNRTIVIGDIHGCYDELQALLDSVAPTNDDRIIAIGDIVDRGPDSEKVLEFFRDTPNATSIMGNHERKHIRSARGETRAASGQKIVRQQCGDRYDAWLAFMETFPRHIELPEAILIHGMFEPGVPLEQQKDTVVIGTLTGERYMSKRHPGPWYEHYDGTKPLIVGHHDYLRQGGEPLIHKDLVYGIDTGVAHGGRLTALILPEFRIVSVPSQGDHWTEQRRRYAVLAGSSRSNLDLNWETLAAIAGSVGVEGLPPFQRERAEHCARLVEQCGRLATRLCNAVADLCASIFDKLEKADGWKDLDTKRRASRFALHVQGHPAATLLFKARKGRHKARAGKLDEAFVYGVAKTPRGLMTLAEGLGVKIDLHTRTTDDNPLSTPKDNETAR